MNSEQMQAEIAEISNRIDSIDDPRQCYALVKERIRKHKEQGDIIPDELARMERMLLVECLAESQGR